MIEWKREKHKVLIIAALWSLGYFFYAAPFLSGKMASSRRALADAHSNIKTMKNTIADKERNMMQHHRLSTELARLSVDAEKQSDVSVIGRRLNEMAEQYEISVENLSYGEPVVSGKLTEYPINIELNGSFFSIGDFIIEAEKAYSNVSWKIKRISGSHPLVDAQLVLDVRKLNG